MAPNQSRLSDHLSLVIYHGRNKLKALIAFTSIFKGEHIKYTDMVEVIEGHKIHVKYDSPCAVQIDGDCILDVIEYWAEKN